MATEIKSTSIKSQNIIAEPQANKPGSPEAGQIIQATGTGDIAKGIYHYSGAAWMSLDNAQGDLETLRLIMSTDTSAVGFSSALNSTSTLAGNTNAVPHETSTGTGLLGALEIPSTGGDALLTEFDANKVFRYFSAGANNNNDYFGIPVDIPAQTRGQNIVIKFKYRTEEASATTSNGDFQVSVWDKSNGVKTTQASTLTTGTTISAGSNILMTSKTNLSVGDKIWFETGGTGSTVGGVANSLTQAYITEISSTDNNIKVSEDVQVIASGLAVTGWLSDKTSGLLPSADSDTNKVGKDFSIAVKTEEDTEQVVVWFSNKSTTTNVIELFFDGILVSQNKFLQASSKGKPEIARYVTWDDVYQSYTPYYTTENQNTFTGQYGTWQNGSSTSYTHFEASCRCKVTMSLWQRGNASGDNYVAIIINDLSSTDPMSTSLNANRVAFGKGLDNDGANCTAEVILNKGDTIRPASNSGVYSGEEFKAGMNIMVEPLESEAIILESQDEIFTDTVSYTPTWTGLGTVSENKATWSRIGDKMYIMGNVKSGTTSGTTISFTLPSGYNIDGSKLGIESNTSVTGQNVGHAGQQNGAGRSFLVLANTVTATDKLYFGGASTGSTIGIPSNSMGNTENLTFRAIIPIQGWNSNFNPLLSLPLVEIGNNNAEYSGYFNGANVGYGKYVNTVYTDTLSTSGLCAVTAGTSTTAFNLQAQQRVKVTVSMSNGHSSTNWYYGVVAGTASAVTDHTVSFSNSALDGYRITGSELEGNSGIYSQTAVCVLEPGENLQVRTSNNGGTSYSGGINSLFSIFVEKDFSNTNMAHIIKPAVAVLSDVKGGTTNGGDSVSTGWTPRELNTINGESWFVTLSGTGTTGLGGTNTDFTLEPGTYEIEAFAPFYNTAYTQLRLYDKTNSSIAIVGTNNQTVANNGFINGPVYGVLNITASTEYCLQYRTSTAQSTYGLGEDSTFSAAGDISKFANVKIRKLK